MGIFMPKIEKRAKWGAQARSNGWQGRKRQGKAQEVFIHHDAGATISPNATVAQERARMRQVEATGLARFGTFSYQLAVFPSGRAYWGLSGWNVMGAHVAGRNSTTVGIVYMGNTERDPMTDAAVKTIRKALSAGRGRYWLKGAMVRAHRDVAATACPGRMAFARMGEIRTVLTVPTPAPPASKPVGHVKVQRGDTMSAIAARLGLTLAALLAANPKIARNPNNIQIGQRVYLPIQVGQTAVSAPAPLGPGTRNCKRMRKAQKGLKRVFPSYDTATRVVRAVGASSRLRLVSGNYGPVTEAWIREFQHRALDNHGRPLIVDGIIGPLTGGAMRRFGIKGLGW